jgi:hypothetical protein
MMTDRFGTEHFASARQVELMRNAMVESATRQEKVREPLPRHKVRARLVGVTAAAMLLLGFLTFGGGFEDAASASSSGGGGGGGTAIGYEP